MEITKIKLVPTHLCGSYFKDVSKQLTMHKTTYLTKSTIRSQTLIPSFSPNSHCHIIAISYLPRRGRVQILIATFLGDGPFHFTSLPNVDLRSTLSYTPMIRKNSKSLGFYIIVNKISIRGTPVLTKSLSVKPSTVVPYTILRSDIYKSLIASFSKATRNIPRVTAVKPFSVCLKVSPVRSAPSIDLETESGKRWTISKHNLMKDSGNGGSCLALIDGGSSVKDAIVLGTFQMENNFFFFDLVNQKLGFSSSIKARGTSCSSFNFTETP